MKTPIKWGGACTVCVGDELNVAFEKKVSNMFDDFVSKIVGKYLQISNSTFTFILAQGKK